MTYNELHEQLKNRPSLELIGLLDERSIKVGDTAAGVLSMRDEWEMILDAILTNALRTRNGKVRALNFLSQRGRRIPEAIHGYLHLINDSHKDVVSCALFGVVFWNNPRYLATVKEISAEKVQFLVKKAIAALENGNPYLYSPNFIDDAGVWMDPATR